jgi:hypothetical protein
MHCVYRFTHRHYFDKQTGLRSKKAEGLDRKNKRMNKCGSSFAKDRARRTHMSRERLIAFTTARPMALIPVTSTHSKSTLQDRQEFR